MSHRWRSTGRAPGGVRGPVEVCRWFSRCWRRPVWNGSPLCTAGRGAQSPLKLKKIKKNKNKSNKKEEEVEFGGGVVGTPPPSSVSYWEITFGISKAKVVWAQEEELLHYITVSLAAWPPVNHLTIIKLLLDFSDHTDILHVACEGQIWSWLENKTSSSSSNTNVSLH